MAIELIDFESLDAILGLNGEESKYVDLAAIKDSVVAMFESHTGRTFSEDKYSEELFIYSSSKMIPLKALPILSIESVSVDDVEIFGGITKNYGVELPAKVNSCKVSVSYSGGIVDVPAALQRAALLQTVYEYQNKHSIGLEIVSTPGGTVTKPQVGMLKEVEKLLSSFIHPFPTF